MKCDKSGTHRPVRLHFQFAIILALILITSMSIFGLLSPTAQASPTNQSFTGLFGTVVALDQGTLILDTPTGAVQITIPSNAVVDIPGKADSSTEDIQIGDILAVLAHIKGPSNDLAIAIKILVKPQEFQEHLHVFGIVIESTPGELTLLTIKGNRVTMGLSHGLMNPIPGQAIIAIVQKDLFTEILKATTIVRAEDVVNRIVKSILSSEEQGNTARVNQLKKVLEANISLHLTAIEKTRVYAPPQYQNMLNQALLSSFIGNKDILQSVVGTEPFVVISGIIKSGSANTNKLSIITEDRRQIEITVTNPARIFIDGTSAPFGDLSIGHRVEADYNPITGQASHLRVVREELETETLSKIKTKLDEGTTGMISQISPPRVIIHPDSGPPLPVFVTKNTEISVGGKKASLEDLRVGMPVQVTYQGNLAATKITSLLVPVQNQRIEGVITGLVRKLGEVTVTTQDDNYVTISITGETHIEKDSNNIDIRTIQLGDIVTYGSSYTPATKKAVYLRIESPSTFDISGVITGKQVSPLGKDVTILTQAFDFVSIKLTANTELQKDGKRVKYTDLEVGDHVKSGRYNPGTAAASRLWLQAPQEYRISGILLTIDLDFQLIHVRLTDGSTLALRLSKKSRVEKNGSRSGSLDLEVNDSVMSAHYNPENLELLRIIVSSPGKNTTPSNVNN